MREVDDSESTFEMNKRKAPEPEVSSGSLSDEWSADEAPVIEVDVPGEATYWLPFNLVGKRSASFLASVLKDKSNDDAGSPPKKVKITGQGPFDPIFHYFKTGHLNKPPDTSWTKLQEVIEYYKLMDMFPLVTRVKVASGVALERLVETSISPEVEAVSISGMCSASFYFAFTPGDPSSLRCIPERQMGAFMAGPRTPPVGVTHCLSKSTRAALGTILKERGFSASFYISTAYSQSVTRSPFGPLPDEDYSTFPLDLLSIPGYGQAYDVPSQRWQPSPNPAHLLIVSW
eukprot:jgi/Botrbrau1/16971/Bobra.49_2s0032.1